MLSRPGLERNKVVSILILIPEIVIAVAECSLNNIEDEQNIRFKENPECLAVLNVFTEFYKNAGFEKP